MMTTDREGRSCRGFLVHVTTTSAKGRKERTVTYGAGAISKPLCLDEAAQVCREAEKRGLRVVVETNGCGGQEYMGGKELLELADWQDPEELIGGDERRTLADIQREENRARLAELSNRRLVAKELDTTVDWVDARDAENPLLAWAK